MIPSLEGWSTKAEKALVSSEIFCTAFQVSGFNTLTANYEYSRNNTDDLPLPVQMQLSGKLKTFS